MTEKKSKSTRGDETRNKLIHVGARLFAQHGFNGVSMRTLVAEANVNLATVSYHFGSKNGLYEAIILYFMNRRVELFPATIEVQKRLAAANGSPDEIAKTSTWLIHTLMNALIGNEENIWFAFILSRELVHSTEMFSVLEENFFIPNYETIESLAHAALGDQASNEECTLISHAIIGIFKIFVESQTFVLHRLHWTQYNTENINTISTMLSKRINGFLGLPME